MVKGRKKRRFQPNDDFDKSLQSHHFSKIVLLFVLSNLIVKIYIALRPLEHIDGLLIPDDAYLSLTIARNIAKGLGPLYGTELTNGFQPLFVFLMVPVYILYPNDLFTPIHISLVILSIFDTLTLLLLFKLVKLFAENFWTYIFLGIGWIFNLTVLKNSLNGLETSVSVFLIVLTLYVYFKFLKSRQINFNSYFISGIICGLAIFARIDNIFLLAAICIMFLIQHNSIVKQKIKYVSYIILGSITSYLPWIVYSFYFTGEIFPISGKAVRYMSLAQVNHNPTWDNWYSKIFTVAIKVIFTDNGVLILILLVLLAIALLYKRNFVKDVIKEHSPVATLIILSLFLFFAYTLYIFTFWFYERYFYPIVLLFIIADSLIVSKINQFPFKKNILQFTNIFLITLLILGNISHEYFAKVFLSKDIQTLGYMNVGLWCSKNFKSGMTIGSSQTGAMGYFAPNLNVVNLDGVVSKSCYNALKNKLYMEYIKEKKIQTIIGWQQNLNFIKTESMNFRDSDLTVLGSIPGIKTRNYEWFVCRVNY